MRIDHSTLDVVTSFATALPYENAEYSGSQSRYRADVDGMRAIAVSSVVFFHAGLFPFSSGFVGVDVFFVISGYLIGGIIVRGARKGRFDFANFYARRARRILPALVVVVLATCLLGWFLLDAAELFFVGATATSTLLAVSNFSFWRLQDYFASDSRLSPLLMTWSLGIEEQFYVFFPFLIIGIMRLARDRLLTIIAALTFVSFVIAVWCTRAYPAAAFYLLPPRAWELGVGATLAAWQIKRAQRVPLLEFLQSKAAQDFLSCAGFLLLALAIVGFDEDTPFRGFTALLPVLGTAALISAERSWANRHVLSCRPMVFVGLISYSWYLWHWPMMSYLRIIVPNPPPLWQLMIIVIVSFAVAVLSWRFVERPFRRATLASRPTLLRYALVLALALVAPAAIKLGKGLPQRLPEQTKQIEVTVGAGLDGPCSAAWDESKPNLSSDCVVIVENRPAVALIGDSHAWALAPGLRERAAQQNLGFRMFTKPACPPLLGVSVRSKDQPALTEACAAFMTNSLQQLVSDPSVKVILLAGLWDNPLDRYVDYVAPESSRSGTDLLRAGLERMVGALRNGKKQVVLVGDSPYWRFDPMRLALAKSIPLRGLIFCLAWPKCAVLSGGAVGLDYIVPPNPRSVEIVREAAAPDGPRYLDLFGRFCDVGRCTFERENELLFIDKSHLSALGARYALERFNILSDE